MSSNLACVGKFDHDFSRVDMKTLSVSSSVSLRVYSNTQPRTWKIADLQKGLILVYDGVEMVGEGAGFGFPVAIYADETYFSGSSRVFVSRRDRCWVVRKEFVMDRVARNRFRRVKLENRTVRRIFGYLADIYQKHPRSRFLVLKGLTWRMDIDTAFVEAASRGMVVVTYAVDGSRIIVKADFNGLDREGLEKVFVLNEQGSRFFKKYVDSEGRELADREIGAWDGIDGEWGCLKIAEGDFGFRLWRVGDAVLRMGREFLRNSLDWVGLDYEVNSRKGAFEYAIEVLGV